MVNDGINVYLRKNLWVSVVHCGFNQHLGSDVKELNHEGIKVMKSFKKWILYTNFT